MTHCIAQKSTFRAKLSPLFLALLFHVKEGVFQKSSSCSLSFAMTHSCVRKKSSRSVLHILKEFRQNPTWLPAQFFVYFTRAVAIALMVVSVEFSGISSYVESRSIHVYPFLSLRYVCNSFLQTSFHPLAKTSTLHACTKLSPRCVSCTIMCIYGLDHLLSLLEISKSSKTLTKIILGSFGIQIHRYAHTFYFL